MREPLLARDPEIESLDMPTLIAIATQIEQESVERYGMLAETMERRGELATAAAFAVMVEEEQRHVEAVARWANAVGGQTNVPPRFDWELPADLATSWEEVAGSALLTPYRAFAMAVDNEMRAFAFYTFLIARAEDDQVRAQAEKLAGEELRHASLMRRWRRQAWHRQRAANGPRARKTIETHEALHRFLRARETGIAGHHRLLAQRLRGLGDEESADLLESLGERSALVLPDDLAERTPVVEPAGEEPVHLLVAAQRPLESLSEALEAVMRTSEGALFADANKAMATVVKRLARISLQVGERMAARPSAQPAVHSATDPSIASHPHPSDPSASPKSDSPGDVPTDRLGDRSGNRHGGAGYRG